MATALLATAGWLTPPGILQNALLVAAATVAVVLIGSVLVNRTATGWISSEFSPMLRFLEDDSTPTFILDRDQTVLWSNPAGQQVCPDAVSGGIERALRPLTSEAGPLMRRLRRGLDKANVFATDVVIRRGHARFVLRGAADGQMLLRLEALSERHPGPGTAVAFPVMTIGQSGTVLSMNEPLRRLLGRRVRSLDAVFTNPLAEDATQARLDTPEGPIAAHIHQIPLSGGRREVAILPMKELVTEPTGSALDDVPVALVQMRPNGEILETNAAAQALLGLNTLSPSLRFQDVLTGLGRSITDWLADAAVTQKPIRAEVLRLRGAKGDSFLQVNLARTRKNGAPILTAVLHDATELKTLEAQFVQSQKMQAIGQLAGGIAHDFNNLLTAISGHCDLLLLGQTPGDPEYGDLVQINQNANRAAALVGQLLAFSRKQTLQPEVIDLRDTLSDLTHLLNRLVGEKTKLTLLNDRALCTTRADKRQLEQVLMNLVVNARDAMPDGGDIVIETRRMHLREPLQRGRATMPPGEYACVSVTDQGVGIAPEHLPQIFEPFYTTKRQGEGTGLGLSTAYGIVKQSGGFIFAESVPGQGTEFQVYFPAYVPKPKPEAEQEAPRKTRAAPPGEGVILLVEDEAPVRAFAARALRLNGYTVLEAESAEAALETLQNPGLEVDLFVTDVIMPGLDGPSWVRQALTARPEVKVVFVSGYAEDLLSDDRDPVPNSVFLPKPFSLVQLTNTVHEQIAKAS